MINKDKLHTYGSDDEKVIYAARRLENLGVEPYRGEYNKKALEMFTAAMQQAHENNTYVGVYFDNNIMKGLFVVAPPKEDEHPDFREKFMYYIKNQEDLRWDKPIDQQKQTQEFDRFNLPGYRDKIKDKYGVCSLEVCYADEILTKQGTEPYIPRHDVITTFDIFKQAICQSEEHNHKPVVVWLNNPDISGLFTVKAPKDHLDEAGLSSMFKDYKIRQAQLRHDKPIEQQKLEQNNLLLHSRDRSWRY